MHWALTCCKSWTVSAQNWYSLTASPAQSTRSTDGISARTRRKAFGSAWISERMPIFTRCSVSSGRGLPHPALLSSERRWGGRQHHTRSHLCCIERVAVDTSGQGPRVLTVLDEHRAVHDSVGNALRPLADTPAIVGEVVY